ncbi:hypothetical protein ACFCV3_00740 [Kribbella sp. NPDC056345]|uniref:hypothetical protein n=1 Tax=Kribbella sp. NPDC056345 TaxID=3345789 RepID=UPI0035D709C5
MGRRASGVPASWAHGVRKASLWTLAENPTGSVILYGSLGYRIAERQPRYRKSF